MYVTLLQLTVIPAKAQRELESSLPAAVRTSYNGHPDSRLAELKHA
jgi:hypothetical protein